MCEYMMPAPGEGAGNDAGRTKPQDRIDLTPVWACPEINIFHRPMALSHAAEEALDFAEVVHDMESESRGRLFPNAIRERCANPLLLLRYLPGDATPAVRREAERMLRAWPM
ncbi:MAG: hypothetical protein ACK4G2_04835 [Novosphingobium sp.]